MAKSVDDMMKNPMPMPQAQQTPQQETQQQKEPGFIEKRVSEFLDPQRGFATLYSHFQGGLQDAQNSVIYAFPDSMQQAAVPGMAGFSTQYQLTQSLEGKESDGLGLGYGRADESEVHGSTESEMDQAKGPETGIHGPQETPSSDMSKLQAYTQNVHSRSNENEMQR